MPPRQVTVPMSFERSTANTHRYRAEHDDAPITTLYVRKGTFGDGQLPQHLVLTVRAEV